MLNLRMGDEVVAHIVFLNRKVRFNNKIKIKKTGVFVPVGAFKTFLECKKKYEQNTK